MKALSLRRSIVASMAAPCFATLAAADIALYDTARYQVQQGEVSRGVFSSNVYLDHLAIGEASYRAQLDEFIEVTSARVYAASERGFTLLSDEELASGDRTISFAVARDLDPDEFHSALDAMQGRNLGHMLFSDGSAAVRLDVMLAFPLYDNKPSEADLSPEALVIGSFSNHTVRVWAIIAGNVDQPILSQQYAELTVDDFDASRTPVTMLIHANDAPKSIAIVGLDLHGHLGLRSGEAVLGYRMEIDASPGLPVMFNIIGAGGEAQRVLHQDMLAREEQEDASLGSIYSGGGGGSMSAFAAAVYGFATHGGGISAGGGGRPAPPTGTPPQNNDQNPPATTPPTPTLTDPVVTPTNSTPVAEPGKSDGGLPADPHVPAPGAIGMLLLGIFSRHSRTRG